MQCVAFRLKIGEQQAIPWELSDGTVLATRSFCVYRKPFDCAAGSRPKIDNNLLRNFIREKCVVNIYKSCYNEAHKIAGKIAFTCIASTIARALNRRSPADGRTVGKIYNYLSYELAD